MKKCDLIFKKKGNKEPLSKRAKSNYPLYKLSKDLKLEEIKLLITDRRNKIKYEKDHAKILKCKEDILLLEDLYKIKRAEDITILNRWRDEKQRLLYNNVLGARVGCMISCLGYTNTIYKNEGIKISEKVYHKDLESNFDLVACSIVKEILGFYNASFEEEKLLKMYGLDKIYFYKIYFNIHKWCQEHYWIKN